MQMMILRNAILDGNDEYTIRWIQLLSVRRLCQCDQCERPQSVNDFSFHTVDNHRAALSHPSKVNELVGVIAEKANDAVVAAS